MSKTQIFSETLAETMHSQRHDRPGTVQISPAFGRMGKALTSVVLAASLLIGSAAPSLADRQSDNFAKALGAALIIGLALNATTKSQAQAAPAPAAPQPRYEAPRVPAFCAITLDDTSGHRPLRMYSDSCLRDQGFRNLPDCARPVRIFGQRDFAYSERCLREAGYRTRGRSNR